MAGTCVSRPFVALRRRLGDEDHRHRYPTAAIPSPRRQAQPRFPASSSLRKNPIPKLNQAAEYGSKHDSRRPDDAAPPLRTSLPRLVTRLFSRVRHSARKRILIELADDNVLDIISIALPAVLSLAADPITSLVDTAFVGHLGPVELAAVGVSASVFNLVSKLFNVPLLNVTTSFVAQEQALHDRRINSPKTSQNEKDLGVESTIRKFDDSGGHCKKFLPAVSTSLALAAGVGIMEAISLYVGSGFLMNAMGISVDSPMRAPAEHFLTLRAWGAPPIVVALAAQGAFRGFMDTKTPLLAVGLGNLLNGILDPILIFLLDLGIGGAAVATVISEYLIAIILVWKLNQNVLLILPEIDGREILRYLKSGGLLIGRTIAVLVTMTLSTSMAAREGPISMAGHQICLQVWLTVSLLNDALALAGQALLANVYTQGDYKKAQVVVDRTLQMGLITGIALAIILFFGFGYFSALITTDSAVLHVAQSGVLFVALSQPVNALAFVFDGLYYGLSDFAYASYSMVLMSLLSSILILVVTPHFGLAGVWAGLFIFMLLRMLAGFWRLHCKNSPWQIVRMEKDGDHRR